MPGHRRKADVTTRTMGHPLIYELYGSVKIHPVVAKRPSLSHNEAVGFEPATVYKAVGRVPDGDITPLGPTPDHAANVGFHSADIQAKRARKTAVALKFDKTIEIAIDEEL